MSDQSSGSISIRLLPIDTKSKRNCAVTQKRLTLNDFLAARFVDRLLLSTLFLKTIFSLYRTAGRQRISLRSFLSPLYMSSLLSLNRCYYKATYRTQYTIRTSTGVYVHVVLNIYKQTQKYSIIKYYFLFITMKNNSM